MGPPESKKSSEETLQRAAQADLVDQGQRREQERQRQTDQKNGIQEMVPLRQGERTTGKSKASKRTSATLTRKSSARAS